MFNSTQNVSTPTVSYDVDANGNLFQLTETVSDVYTQVDPLGVQPQIQNLQMDITGYQANVDKNTQAITDANAQIASLQAQSQAIITAVPTLAEKLTSLANAKINTSLPAVGVTDTPPIDSTPAVTP
jgi:hypothetical protein